MKKFVFTIALLVAGFATFAQQADHFIKPYINIKNALVNSDAKAAASAINSLNETLKAEKDFPQKAELGKAIEKLTTASDDLEKQRAAFNAVSTQLWTLVKGADELSQSVFYQYCPMKKAYWLSTEKEIKNPYYGASMLNCGKVVETKEK